MRKRLNSLLILALLLVGALGVQPVRAMDSPHFALNWLTFTGTTSTNPVSSTNFKANLSLGQTVIGAAESAGYKVQFGFWAEDNSSFLHKSFLPFTIKSNGT